jgi:putative endonuclease
MRWSVYMLRCSGGSLYTGATNNLSHRLQRHARGKGARYTRSRLPVQLVFSQPVKDKGAALRREAALKRLTRAEKLSLLKDGGASKECRSPKKRPPPQSHR